MEMQYIPDLVSDVVSRVNSLFATRLTNPFNVQFDFGHHLEVQKNLQLKDGSITQKNLKYPLVWLVMDFEERMGTRVDMYAEVNLHIIICTLTEPTYRMDERRDKTFLPTLYPIYNELLNQFDRSNKFQSGPTIPHSKFDRPYFNDGSGPNLFNDFVDAIQIKNFRINVKNIC